MKRRSVRNKVSGVVVKCIFRAHLKTVELLLTGSGWSERAGARNGPLRSPCNEEGEETAEREE